MQLSPFTSWSSVGYLLFHCGPTSIAWFVIAIVIYAIKGKTFRRHIPNICVEIRKCVPTFTNFYTSTSVVMVLIIFRIFASLNKKIPSSVNACSYFTVNRQKFSSEASTRLSIFASKPVRLNFAFFSARAFANKEAFLCAISRNAAYYGEPSEDVSNIDWWAFRHAYNYKASMRIQQ